MKTPLKKIAGIEVERRSGEKRAKGMGSNGGSRQMKTESRTHSHKKTQGDADDEGGKGGKGVAKGTKKSERQRFPGWKGRCFRTGEKKTERTPSTTKTGSLSDTCKCKLPSIHETLFGPKTKKRKRMKNKSGGGGARGSSTALLK